MTGWDYLDWLSVAGGGLLVTAGLAHLLLADRLQRELDEWRLQAGGGGGSWRRWRPRNARAMALLFVALGLFQLLLWAVRP